MDKEEFIEKLSRELGINETSETFNFLQRQNMEILIDELMENRQKEEEIEDLEDTVDTLKSEVSELEGQVYDLEQEYSNQNFEVEKQIDQNKIDLLVEKGLINIPLDKLEEFLNEV